MPLYSLDGVSPELPNPNEFWIAPSADVIGRVRIHRNASVWFNAVLRGDNEWLEIGESSNIQDGAVLHSDIGAPLTISKNCTVGHKAILHGCMIGEGTLIGMGATILNHAKIGKGCLIGANTLISEGKEIPDHSLVVGAPGRIIRTLDNEAVQNLIRSAEGYVKNWKRFASGLKQL